MQLDIRMRIPCQKNDPISLQNPVRQYNFQNETRILNVKFGKQTLKFGFGGNSRWSTSDYITESPLKSMRKGKEK